MYGCLEVVPFNLGKGESGKHNSPVNRHVRSDLVDSLMLLHLRPKRKCSVSSRNNKHNQIKVQYFKVPLISLGQLHAPHPHPHQSCSEGEESRKNSILMGPSLFWCGILTGSYGGTGQENCKSKGPRERGWCGGEKGGLAQTRYLEKHALCKSRRQEEVTE